MPDQKPRQVSLRKKAEAGGRSEVYLWLIRRRRHVLETLGAKQLWETIAREMAAAGVLTQKGGSPTRLNVRKAWVSLERNLAKEDAAKKKEPPRMPRSYRPNVEPPSRPPPNYDTIRYPSPMTAEPRYRLPPNQIEGAAAADPGVGSPTSRPPSEMTPVERMADVERTLREMSGYQPQIQRRGKIV